MSETPPFDGPPAAPAAPGQPIGGSGPGVWDPEFFQNPYPTYAWLRENDPVRGITWPGPPGHAWLVTRYQDVHAGQADSRLRHDLTAFMAELGIPEPPAIGGDVARLLGRNLTLLDAPDHPRLRSVLARFFTKKRIEGMRPRIETLADGLLDQLAERAGDGPVDLVRDFAWKLPLAVVCELLGVPAEDHELFGYGTDASRDQGATGDYAAGAVVAVERLRALIGEKRANPADDAFTSFVRALDAGEFLDEDEVIAQAMLFVVAGHETTVDLLGNGVHALLSNPDQLKQLTADPSLLPNAVEEVLRYYPPTDIVTPQYTAEPIRFGDVEVDRHQIVILSRASANRDPERYPDPERFDITRNTAGHLAFGHGAHYCVGGMVARIEGQTVFGRIFDRFPELRHATAPEEVRWKSNPVARGLVSLPVDLGTPRRPGKTA
ncbi:cytochrome P450 [Streptomyces sp. NBC_01591]|uniref:cytochrome P450 family protein n=1 Tax=Streptomyces sp. NBC_01591 TaxID=2975888 RepID=UPI002DDC2186|nr:cytochrome P450 [Streptomyces sp. NBC_01591]WSD70613.1 cytochrome P450 [Streptomyces sp. NBC_01591]